MKEYIARYHAVDINQALDNIRRSKKEKKKEKNKNNKVLATSVDYPKHYNMGGIEVIDAIDAWDLDFSLGNAIKYIARAGHKQDYEGQDQIEKTINDLDKAIWYINHKIDILKSLSTDDKKIGSTIMVNGHKVLIGKDGNLIRIE